MPLDLRTLGVAAGVDVAVAAASLSAFTLLRVAKWTRRFYAPKRYSALVPPGRRPPRLRPLLWLWAVARLPLEAVTASAGADGAVFLLALRMGLRLFLYLSVWCLAVVLPVNMQGREVDQLLALQRPGTAAAVLPPAGLPATPPPPAAATLAALHTAYTPPNTHPPNPTVPPSPWPEHSAAASAPLESSKPSTPSSTVTINLTASSSTSPVPAPNAFSTYQAAPSTPPAPPPEPPPSPNAPPPEPHPGGSGVAPPGTPGSGARYVATDLDKASLANVAPGSRLLWAHLVSIYVVTAVALRVLWTHSREAVALRVLHLTHTQPGGPSHTVLIRDIPGMQYGTKLATVRRLLATAFLLRFLPPGARRALERAAQRLLGGAQYGLVAATDLAARYMDRLDAVLMEQEEQEQQQRRQQQQQRDEVGQGPAAAELPDPSTSPKGASPTARRMAAESAAASYTSGTASPALDNDAGGTSSTKLEGSHEQHHHTANGGSAQPAADVKGLGSADGDGTAAAVGSATPGGAPGGGEGPTGHDGGGEPRRPHHVLSSWARAEEVLDGDDTNAPVLVHRELSEVFPPCRIVAMSVVRDERALAGAVRQYEDTRRRLEDLVDSYAAQLAAGKRPHRKKVRVVGPLLGPWAADLYGSRPVRVDELLHLRTQLQAAWEQLQRGLEREQDLPYVPTAFVTFSRRWDAALVSSALHDRDEALWRAAPAPGPQEVVWSSLRLRLWQVGLRVAAQRLAFGALLLGYVVPVSALQGLLQVRRMETLPVLSALVHIPVVRSLLAGVLPGLALRLLLLALPALLGRLVRWAGAASEAEVDFRATTLCFNFQVVAVFAASFVAGALLNQVSQFVREPGTVLTVLGTGAPQTASFFITYILLNGLVIQPLASLRLFGLAVYGARYGLAATPRARTRLWQSQTVRFAPTAPYHTITILLGLAFCVVNPLILPACVAYFAVVWLLERHQHCYVWSRAYDSGGKLWSQVCSQVMVGVYTMQLVLIALLSIKRFLWAPLALPAPLAAAAFHAAAQRIFARPWSTLALRDAADLDERDRQMYGEDLEEMYGGVRQADGDGQPGAEGGEEGGGGSGPGGSATATAGDGALVGSYGVAAGAAVDGASTAGADGQLLDGHPAPASPSKSVPPTAPPHAPAPDFGGQRPRDGPLSPPPEPYLSLTMQPQVYYPGLQQQQQQQQQDPHEHEAHAVAPAGPDAPATRHGHVAASVTAAVEPSDVTPTPGGSGPSESADGQQASGGKQLLHEQGTVAVRKGQEVAGGRRLPLAGYPYPYLSPARQVSYDAHVALLDEATDMDRRLQVAAVLAPRRGSSPSPSPSPSPSLTLDPAWSRVLDDVGWGAAAGPGERDLTDDEEEEEREGERAEGGAASLRQGQRDGQAGRLGVGSGWERARQHVWGAVRAGQLGVVQGSEWGRGGGSGDGMRWRRGRGGERENGHGVGERGVQQEAGGGRRDVEQGGGVGAEAEGLGRRRSGGGGRGSRRASGRAGEDGGHGEPLLTRQPGV